MRWGRKGIEPIVNKLLEEQGQVQAARLAQRAGISRQAAHRHLAALVEAGVLSPQGRGPATRYVTSERLPYEKTYTLSGLTEDRVWDELSTSAPQLQNLRGNVRRILTYVVTELINNAIDHSSGKSVRVRLVKTPTSIALEIRDDGVGIFRRLREGLQLPDSLSAVQELSKGKVTTDPKRHSGEGIFFISKICDIFSAESNKIIWKVDNTRSDMAVGESDERVGTRIRCEIPLEKARTLQSLFDEYARDFEFSKTRIVVKLFEVGTHFVSRSEAKRILNTLEKFKEVILDFNRIRELGQGFADEVFRVWANQHPQTKLLPIHMNTAVNFMVKRSRRTGRA
jgi:anti-sigma regulatory factor (Ser/Thr protein kinase)